MRRVVLAALALIIAYLLFKPVAIAPVAWHPPAAPKLEGVFAENKALAAVEWLGRDVVHGPEATALAADGRVYMGSRDGTIHRFDPKTSQFEKFAKVAGRALGMQFDGAGNLIVCDADHGLTSVNPAGQATLLTSEQGGIPFKFTDDVDVASDGTIYFTDASSRFGSERYREDVFEHAGNGRFMAYHPATHETELLIGGMNFANGVALSGDQSFVVVNETGSYRALRYWLAGPKKGTHEVFIDNLPGFPDNVTFSKQRGIFWIALFAPRDPIVDLVAPAPFLRKVIMRIPESLQPQAKRHAIALGVDIEGRVVKNLQNDAPDSFSPLTSVRDAGEYLYLGSLDRDALGRVRAP